MVSCFGHTVLLLRPCWHQLGDQGCSEGGWQVIWSLRVRLGGGRIMQDPLRIWGEGERWKVPKKGEQRKQILLCHKKLCFRPTHSLSLSLCVCHASKEGTIIYKIVSIIKLALASRQAIFKGGLVTSWPLALRAVFISELGCSFVPS